MTSRQDDDQQQGFSGLLPSPNDGGTGGGEGEQQEEAFIEAPSISLPTGGGAIRGIDEKFQVNPATGTCSFSIGLPLSPGRNGFGPQLSLSYDSGSGNGPFGIGWNLGLGQITRKTDKGLPLYRDGAEPDVFIISGAEDLVPYYEDDERYEESVTVGGGDTYIVHRYRPRTEGLFARIERWTKVGDEEDNGDIHWRTISPENVLTIYGKDAESRISDPNQSDRIFSWLICEKRDDRGNAIVYEYEKEDGTGIDLSKVQEKNRGPVDAKARKVQRYIKSIRYGNRQPVLDETTGSRPFVMTNTDVENTDWMFEVIFDYGEHDEVDPTPSDSGNWVRRSDPFSRYRSGFEVRTNRLCQRVLMFHHFPGEDVGANCLVRSLDITYRGDTPDAESKGEQRGTFISSATKRGFRPDGSGNYVVRSFPPVEFEYSKAEIDDQVRSLDSESLKNLPQGLSGENYRWVDLDGEGISGVLTEQANSWYYKSNLGDGTFGPQREVPSTPVPSQLRRGRQQLQDVGGNGHLDLVSYGGATPGFFERTADENWQSFQPFKKVPNVNWDDRNLRFIDLDGDGHADVLITEANVFCWHQSLERDGFGPQNRVYQALNEEDGPRILFSNGQESIQLADMSGDGLTDLVRIRNHEVCYWPNLGYGRFGAKITMDGSPHFDAPDLFSEQRIRLADIDGSGVSDIIYFGRQGVRLYFNHSGNAWSEARELPFPRVDDMTSVDVVDLLGRGTACLVWSSPLPSGRTGQMRYVDLMGDTKPHLLTHMKNNLGAEQKVHYVSSTKYYLEDKKAGTPWVTKLPFPVQVVEKVENYDRISRNRFVTRYAYHHGYYDGVERAFHGFGLVETWDTEEFASLSDDGEFPTGDNVDETSHVPPVLTRQWFHTGAFIDGEDISRRYKEEYYREPDLEDEDFEDQLLPHTTLPDGLTAEEARQACRALRGSPLREEVYAIDGSDDENHPYLVSERDFTVKMLQSQFDERHGVFFVHPHESIEYHYEREPGDARVSHSLTLEVNAFGNVLKSASVGYGRASATGFDEQSVTYVTFTELDVTIEVDEEHDYRTPIECEAKIFELTGYEPSGPNDRFLSSDFVEPASVGNGVDPIFDNELSYHVEPTTGKERRIIEHVRTYFRPDDLGTDPLDLLDLGELESMALPGQSFELAFTEGLIETVFQRTVEGEPDEDLLPDPNDVLPVTDGEFDRGGYAQLGTSVPEKKLWWIPSARGFYSADTNATASEELDEARSHFFLKRRYRDPFHTATNPCETLITYDEYDLLPIDTEDALGNRVTVGERDTNGSIDPLVDGYDYRVLQPRIVMDPNRNRSEVAFDALGLVAGTAVMGKPEDDDGDSLVEFEPDLTPSQHSAFFEGTDPEQEAKSLLGSATSRVIYDVHRYQNTSTSDEPQPVAAATVMRTIHVSDLEGTEETDIQLSIEYSDGFERVIQQKMLCEPGPVPERDENGDIILGDDGLPEMTDIDHDPRWISSGWTIFNNKEAPVRQYESFFTDSHHFEFEVKVGVSAIMLYDPLERVMATLHPDNTYEKVLFDPWYVEKWDRSDTVLLDPLDKEEEPDLYDFLKRLDEKELKPTWHTQRIGGELGDDAKTAAEQTEVHAETPTIEHFDSLGRPFLVVQTNKYDEPDVLNGSGEIKSEELETRVIYDIEGHEVELLDAHERVIIRNDWDMAGRQIRRASMDAGRRWMLSDIADAPIRMWDERGHNFRSEYDCLRRPTAQFVEGTDNDASDPRTVGGEILFEKMEYGEDETDALEHNLRGHVVRSFDGAGVVVTDEYDFKGTLLRSSRQLAAEYRGIPDWSGTPGLETEEFVSKSVFDAVGRPVEIEKPDGSTVEIGYDQAGLLKVVEAMAVDDSGSGPTFAVTDITYDAKGQRQSIEYDSGVATEYEYDPLTFQLRELKTIRDGSDVLQDIHYAYDPMGNVTSIRDHAQQTLFYDNAVVEPHKAYAYDSLYRLIEASGREHEGQSGQVTPTSWNDEHRTGLAHKHDGGAMRTYERGFDYDVVGNLLEMRHQAGTVSWQRLYEYGSTGTPVPEDNRLTKTTVGSEDSFYTHDVHGNMIDMPHLSVMEWDFKDQMFATSRQVVSEGEPETTYYVYDGGGNRVRKVTDRASTSGNPNRKNERIYLGGFEIYREYENTSGEPIETERKTLHVMDNARRVALIETKAIDDSQAVADPQPLLRHQLGDHLESSSIELDEQGDIISYEEYYPYGSTSYQAVDSQTEVSGKRYRFTGKERDEESGLYYHGARYYAPWLSRWTAADPAGMVDGPNLFAYVRGNPVRLVDPDGREGNEPGGTDDVSEFLSEYDVELQEALEHAYSESKQIGLPTHLLRYAFENTTIKIGDSDYYHRNRNILYLSEETVKNLTSRGSFERAMGLSVLYHEAGHVFLYRNDAVRQSVEGFGRLYRGARLYRIQGGAGEVEVLGTTVNRFQEKSVAHEAAGQYIEDRVKAMVIAHTRLTAFRETLTGDHGLTRREAQETFELMVDSYTGEDHFQTSYVAGHIPRNFIERRQDKNNKMILDQRMPQNLRDIVDEEIFHTGMPEYLGAQPGELGSLYMELFKHLHVYRSQ